MSDDLQQPALYESSGSPDLGVLPSVTPSTSSLSRFRQSSLISPVVCDDRAIAGLLEILMHRAGFTVNEMARRLGISQNGVRQYVNSRRTKPSLQWFVRFAETCGAHVYIEFPPGK